MATKQAIAPAPQAACLRPPHAPGLREVAGLLEPVGIEVVAAPGGLDVDVTDVVIQDPFEPARLECGQIVLGVGVRADDPRCAELLRAAAAAGAAAVLLRAPRSDLGAALSVTGQVAILLAPPAVSWNQIQTLLRAAMLNRCGQTEQQAEKATADLFTLANLVSTSVTGAVSIADPRQRRLAYSEAGLWASSAGRVTSRAGHQACPAAQDTLSRLWGSPDVLTWETLEGQRCMGIAVRAAGEILGTIVAAAATGELDPGADVALRDAAAMAVPLLLLHRTDHRLQLQLRAEYVRMLLEGRGFPALLREQLGWSAGASFAVLAFGMPSLEGTERDRAIERVSALVAESSSRQGLAVLDGVVYSVVPAGQQTDPAALRVAMDVVNRAEPHIGVPVLAALGPTVAGLDDLPLAREGADQVLAILAKRTAGSYVAGMEDVQADLLLGDVDALVASSGRHLAKLDSLTRHDAEHDTQYVETLRAFLDHFGNAADGADAIHVHCNTFRYRLRRLIAFSGLDLDDPDERLAVTLLLRARIASR